jgi:hypothetical protein
MDARSNCQELFLDGRLSEPKKPHGKLGAAVSRCLVNVSLPLSGPSGKVIISYAENAIPPGLSYRGDFAFSEISGHLQNSK